MASVPTSQLDQMYVRVQQPAITPASSAQTMQSVAPPALVRCPDGSLVQAGQACPQPKVNWVPWVVGAVAVAAGVGAAYYLARKKGLLAEGAYEINPRVRRAEDCGCAHEEDEE